MVSARKVFENGADVIMDIYEVLEEEQTVKIISLWTHYE